MVGDVCRVCLFVDAAERWVFVDVRRQLAAVGDVCSLRFDVLCCAVLWWK